LKHLEPEIIYGDTDSVMFLFNCADDDVDEDRRRLVFICDYINHKSGLLHGSMEVAPDSLNDWMILMKKKNYIFSQIDLKMGKPFDPKPVSKGVEFIKGDSVPYIREVGRELLDGMVKHQWTKEAIAMFIREKYQDLLLADVIRPVVRSEVIKIGKCNGDDKKEKDDIDDEWVMVISVTHEKMPRDKFLMTMKLSKPIKDYKKNGGGSHVAAARQLQKAGNLVTAGEAIEFYYCKLPNETKKVSSYVMAADLYQQQDLHIQHYATKFIKAFTRVINMIIGEAETAELFKLENFDHVQAHVNTALYQFVKSTSEKPNEEHVHRMTHGRKPSLTPPVKMPKKKQFRLDHYFQQTKKVKVDEEETTTTTTTTTTIVDSPI